MDNEQNQNKNSRIIDVDLQNEMRKSFLDYSMSVIVSRALPDVRDGLKPVHRRILYTMNQIGLDPSKPYHKCADTVGQVLGSYHPHGDASVYDAMVRLAQDFSMRYMLVDGHGNFGSVDGDPPAAYRYIEARMSKISLEMLTDIEKNTVDFMSNYDDRLKEPTVLPSRFPNLLVNGSSGIAVGMATEIPPHNLGETIDAVCTLIDNPDAELAEIMECMPGPDFPTGGIIMGRSGIRAAYATGRGKITVRAKTEIIEAKNGRYKIIVTELPYKVNKARLIENIADLVKDKRIEGISNIEDHSDRKGMHIEIDIKRDASPQIVLNQLFSYTQLQTTFGAIMLSIVDGEPKILSLKEMLQCYIEFQAEVIRRRTDFDLKKARDRAHILEGLKIALDFIDEVIKIIRNSKDTVSAKAGLMERFGLDDVQAQAIVQMRLGQLTNMEQTKIEDEIAALHAKIEEYLEILASEPRQLEIVKEEIMQIRNKYADPRRTEICAVSGEVDIEDLIPQEECVLTLTQFGYVKRLSADTYKIQRRGGRGVSGMSRREEDIAAEMFVINSHDYVLFFTDKGRVFRKKGYQIPEAGRTARGTNIVNVLQVDGDEKISAMIHTRDITSEDRYLVMITRNGTVKRLPVETLKNLRNNGIRALNLDEGDELVSVRETDGEQKILIATHDGMAVVFDETDVRAMGRTAVGVRGIKLREGDYVVGAARAQEGKEVLTITEKGYGKKTPVEEYRITNRGGLGIKNYMVTEKTGGIVGVKVVDGSEDLLLVTRAGILIRTPVEAIRTTGRATQGVIVMRFKEEGDSVISMALTEHEEDDEA